MDWLEQELREALNRKDPAPDFAERVRGRLMRSQIHPARTAIEPFWSGLFLHLGRPLWTARGRWWLATAAGFAIVAGAGALGYREHQGETARREVMQAFRIAGTRLNHIQTQVREARR